MNYTCRNCGSPTTPGQRFCPQCGAVIDLSAPTINPNTLYVPPPTQKPKNNAAAGCAVGCVVIILIFIILGVIGSQIKTPTTPPQPSSTDSSSTPASNDSASSSDTSSGSSSGSQAPAPQPKWVVVQTMTGNGMKKGEPFTVGDHWKIRWKTKPGDMGAMNFQIYVYSIGSGSDAAPTDVAANVIGSSEDSTDEYTAGTYYLDINTAQPYAIQVLDLK